MECKVYPSDAEHIAEAGRIIAEGGVVGFPTETVYGLGADALSEAAVYKIFEAKDRPPDNPLIVHILDADDLSLVIDGEVPEYAKWLMDAYWPGPLTMIFPKAQCVPLAVTAGLSTVAVRVPAHPVARSLIKAAGTPIAAPSANRSGRPSPTTAAHVFQDMNGRIPMILDGGPCKVGLESTVVDATGDMPRILRPGGVTPEMIRGVTGAVEVDKSVLQPLALGEKPRSPGTKYQHYAPKGKLTIVRGAPEDMINTLCALYDRALQDGQSVAILAMGSHRNLYGNRMVRELGGDGADEMAAELFAALREMDDRGVTRILAEAVEAQGMGLAVMNRLSRAAAFDIIDAKGSDWS